MTTLLIVLDELLVVASKGQRWHVEEALAGESLTCAAADPEHPGRAYCGSEQGAWRSDDGGRSWLLASGGLPVRHATAVAAGSPDRRGHPAAVYLGTEPSHLFRSLDGGGSWEELTGLTALPSSDEWSFPPRPETHHARWIEVDPVDPRRIYVAIEAGALVRTMDGGATWDDRVPDGPYDTHTMATHPEAPGRLYSAAGDGYFESADGGTTWRRNVRGLRHRYLVGVGVDPGDPSTVLVSGSSGPWTAYNPTSAETYVYRKTAKAGWQPVGEGLPKPEGTTVTHYARGTPPGVLYAANNRGVFRSDDAGVRWTPEDIAWKPPYEAQGVQSIVMLAGE